MIYRRIQNLLFITICFFMLVCFLSSCGNHKNASEEIYSDGTEEKIEKEYSESLINAISESKAESENHEKDTLEENNNSKSTEESLDINTTEVVISEEITDKVIDIIMVGDILLHTPVEKAALQEDGSYKYDAIFANLTEEISAADLAIVNQEVIIGGEELGISGYPAFNAAYSAGDALVDAGFDVICHGTNHALDKGRRGLLNCISFWKENYTDIAVLGIHDSKESQDNVYIYEQEGVKIAILNFTYGTNGIPLPEDMPFAVDLLQENKVVEQIRLAEELADFTIVCPHWGTEYQLVHSSNQEKWAKIFAENGVDLVIGTHPHVIQPVEWITIEETGHEMLVYYSLGNFVNWTSESGAGIANRMVGGMAEISIVMDGDNAKISEYGVQPVVCHLEEGINGVTVYSLDEYTEELAGRNQIIHQDSAFNLAYCKELCNQVWPQFAE